MSLLSDKDPSPYTLLNPNGSAPIMLTCEHSGQAVPECLNKLGMSDEDFDQHYAYDPGVKEATEYLSQKLDAPAILGNYSRKVVDLGRKKDNTAFPTLGEGKAIIGNQNLSDQDKEERFKAIYEPYHNELEHYLDQHFIGNGVIPMVLSIHSFTPVFHNEVRPWEIAFLWVQDPRLPETLINGMREKGYVVGDNEPYNMKIIRGAVIDRCADSRRLPNVMVEFRNDLIRNHEDVVKHCDALIDVLKPVINAPEMHSYYEGPINPYDPEAEKKYFEQIMRTVTSDDI